MISQTNSSALRSAYVNNFSESKGTQKKENISITKQGDTSKVEQIKMALESGEYQVNLEQLSQKIAKELL